MRGAKKANKKRKKRRLAKKNLAYQAITRVGPRVIATEDSVQVLRKEDEVETEI
jgi:hypothetical protein